MTKELRSGVAKANDSARLIVQPTLGQFLVQNVAISSPRVIGLLKGTQGDDENIPCLDVCRFLIGITSEYCCIHLINEEIQY